MNVFYEIILAPVVIAGGYGLTALLWAALDFCLPFPRRRQAARPVMAANAPSAARLRSARLQSARFRHRAAMPQEA